MASKRLKRLGLRASILGRLSRNNITTCKDFMSHGHLELVRLLGISDICVREIARKVSDSCAPTPRTGLQLQREREVRTCFLGTTLPQLDRVMLGGIPSGTVTEVAGPSGCGKTQFCIMLSMIAVLPIDNGGLGGSVLYIDTEAAFSAERMVEMAQTRFPHQYGSDEALLHLTQNVHLYLESSCVSLLKRLQTLEEDIISKKVKLIILDSVASLVRKEFDSRTGKNMTERTNLLAKEAALLKYLAEAFNIPVIVTNQITTRFNKDKCPVDEDKGNGVSQGGLDLTGDGGYVTAALGNTWSHCVNTRLIVQYLDGPRRQILVAKSPVAPFSTFIYTIQDKGLVLEEGGADHYDGTDPGLQQIRVRTTIPQDAFKY